VPFILQISGAKQSLKIKRCEYGYHTNFNWHYSSVGLVWFEFVKIKGAKIILHVKSPTFEAAKLKGFTVARNSQM